jgi:hypothetical protein
MMIPHFPRKIIFVEMHPIPHEPGPEGFFSGDETSFYRPNLTWQGEQVLSNRLPGREGKEMETYKKMAWVWVALLVYAVGVSF